MGVLYRPKMFRFAVTRFLAVACAGGDEEILHLALALDGKSFAVAQSGWKHDAVLLKGLH